MVANIVFIAVSSVAIIGTVVSSAMVIASGLSRRREAARKKVLAQMVDLLGEIDNPDTRAMLTDVLKKSGYYYSRGNIKSRSNEEMTNCNTVEERSALILNHFEQSELNLIND